jgi:hypothetical protein
MKDFGRSNLNSKMAYDNDSADSLQNDPFVMSL